MVDAAGMTLMPGIIDAHMHVTNMPALLDARGHMRSNLEGVGKLQASLRRGVTTVGNQSGGYESVILRDALNAGLIRGCARMLILGMVNATGGHVRGISADGPWAARGAVREQLHLVGADLVKTAASGGFMWEAERVENPDYTYEELAAICDESHAKGKLVHVHAHSQPGLEYAIRAGCDVIAHGAMIDRQGVEGIAEKGLHYQPTLYVTSARVLDRDNPPKVPNMKDHPHMYERMCRAHPIHREGVRYAHELGVTLSIGTDGGPGAAMLELLELQACGLGAMEAIVAGTMHSASTLGILPDVGTLEPQKQADLLLVDGNPLEDLSLLLDPSNLSLVVKDGRPESGAGPWRTYVDLAVEEEYRPRRLFSWRPDDATEQ
jgi:imidazolonepropionase-like amidohydrolase